MERIANQCCARATKTTCYGCDWPDGLIPLMAYWPVLPTTDYSASLLVCMHQVFLQESLTHNNLTFSVVLLQEESSMLITLLGLVLSSVPASITASMSTPRASSSAPAVFGHGMRQHFRMDEGYVNMNFGSYGTTAIPVLCTCGILCVRIGVCVCVCVCVCMCMCVCVFCLVVAVVAHTHALSYIHTHTHSLTLTLEGT